MVMSKVLKLMNHTNITVPGFRSTFRDRACEQINYAWEIIERALTHKWQVEGQGQGRGRGRLRMVYHAGTEAEIEGQMANHYNTREAEPIAVIPIRPAKSI